MLDYKEHVLLLSNKHIWWWLMICCTLEVLSQTYGQHYGNKDLAALIYLFAGIAVGVLPLLRTHPPVADRMEGDNSVRWQYVAFGLLTLGVFYFGGQAIQSQPLDYTFADMLPIIKVMGERWLAGDAVYATIPEIWDGMQPIYLPVLWLAYVPALALEVDMRYVNLVFILLACAAALVFWRKPQQKSYWWRYVPVLLLLSYVLIDYTTLITITEEPIVVGCYALLGYGLYRRKTALIIAGLVGCLLSRYALVFWAVVWWGYTLWQGNQRRALWIAAGTAVLGILVMWISEGIYEIELFYGLKDAYLDSFENPDLAWRTKNTVVKNIGMARFVPFEQLVVLHRWVFWGSMILPALLYIWYHLRLRERVAAGLFALCSLKLCLVYFFNMNALPYSYLFYTSTMLSLVVLGAQTVPLQK